MGQSPKRHRFPPSLIAHAVWQYFRFALSLRLIEEMLLERGIVVSYETIRCWAKKFGPDYAARLRPKAPSPNDVWHLDEGVPQGTTAVSEPSCTADEGLVPQSVENAAACRGSGTLFTGYSIKLYRNIHCVRHFKGFGTCRLLGRLCRGIDNWMGRRC